MEQLVETEDPDKKTFNINGAVVNASISIGIGYSQMSEFISLLEIPPLSKKKYGFLHDNLVEAYNDTAWDSMLEAGKEEKKWR